MWNPFKTYHFNVEDFIRENQYTSYTGVFSLRSCDIRSYYCRNIYIVEKGFKFFQIVEKPEIDQWLSSNRCEFCGKTMLCYKKKPVLFIETVWDKNTGLDNMYYYGDRFYIRKIEEITGLVSWYYVKIWISTTSGRYVFYTKKLTYAL